MRVIRTEKIVNQIELMDYFNIAKDSLLAMEKEGLPFKGIVNLEKEYDIERVKEWYQRMREEIHSMVIDKEYDNKEISRIFKCGNMGGMRQSKKTNTLVLFSDHTKGIYDDRWDEDILHRDGPRRRSSLRRESK
ncbi:hypothetical protein [Bacillus paramycoides]|uniref:hypothetical protein n=1 Tax=Bacillus paramycoides TaxID=2026194 RepID=UPI000AAA4379|nr:hypothetical protein [Bacillus paramycoides]